MYGAWLHILVQAYAFERRQYKLMTSVSTPPPATMVQILPFGFKIDSFNEAPEIKQDMAVCGMAYLLHRNYFAARHHNIMSQQE